VLGRSVIANALGQLSVLVIGMVSTIALARWLGPADRGILALMAYTWDVIIAVAAAGFTYAVAYFASRRDADRGAILGNSLLVGGVLAVVFIPFFAIYGPTVADHLTHGRGGDAWRLVGIVVVVTFLDWCIHNQLLGKLQFGRLNALIALSGIASLVAIVLFVGLAGWGVAGGLAATVAASVVMIVGSLLALRGLRPSVDLQLLRAQFAYGGRVAVGWIFQIINYRADVFILQAYVSLRAIGEYVIASLVAELSLTGGSALATSVNALVANYEGEDRQTTTISASLRHGLILTAVVIVGLAIFGGLAIKIAFGSSYAGAIEPMYILLPGMLFLGMGSVVTGNLRGIARPGVSSIIAGVTMAITIGLDVLLIPKWGINGAALASTIAYTFHGTTCVLVLSRITGIPLRNLIVPTASDWRAYQRALSAMLGAANRARVRVLGRG
jgi:O-antigen/teichoic acid export membrane protein